MLQQSEPTRFLGKQPICDLHCQLFGYELLFRAGRENAFSGDPEAATQQVIDSYLHLTHARTQWTSFVNCTRDALVSGIVHLLPPKTTVLEIPETLDPDDELIASCRALRLSGYRFALDDFSPDPCKHAWLEFADIVKLDFRASDRAERQAIYDMVRHQSPRLLAEKVETESEVAAARDEGCTLFQGYFFSRPIIVSHRPVPGNCVSYLRVLAALSAPAPSTPEIERLVLSDPTLCYRLLRIVNSAVFGAATHVTSIHTALLLVGHDGMRRLVTIAMAGLLGPHQPRALSLMSLERGRFCELLAPLLGQDPSEWYLLGMLSLIDVIMQANMSSILELLALSSEVKEALYGETTSAGTALEFLRRYEAGDWDACEGCLQRLKLTESQVTPLYVSAVQWAAAALPV
jgi:EAL and modified HD-GYP domain-containing signal transduction protein